jgi:hypothetical protein
VERAPVLFGVDQERQGKARETLIAQPYQQIGQLKVELNFCHRSPDYNRERRLAMIDQHHSKLSLACQCTLLSF